MISRVYCVSIMIEKPKEQSNLFTVGKAFILSATISGYLLAPLIVIGGGGWLLDKKFSQNNHVILFFSIGVAFIIGNVIVFKRSQALARQFSKKK